MWLTPLVLLIAVGWVVKFISDALPAIFMPVLASPTLMRRLLGSAITSRPLRLCHPLRLAAGAGTDTI